MSIPLGRASRIGPYDILETIGQGAMGEVFLAQDSRLSRRVAIKTISKAGESDPARKSRFVQEARAASALNHPNIVTIHDFGTEAGISYIVTELVDGESLRDVIRRGPVPLRRLLDVAIQIADALAAAHEAGIVHRDLKPENIMLTRAGRVKLLDFGLAKPLLESDPAHTIDELGTQPGLLLGTVAYMSPEQARGNPAGFESDQFSFGVILQEMATGHNPMQRETPMETLIAVANYERPPFTPGPVALRKLVERAMAREPEKRFGRTVEIHERLVKIRGEMPEAPQRKRPSLQLSRRTVRIAVTAVLGIAVLAAAAWRLAQPRFPDPMSYRMTLFSNSTAPELWPEWSPDDRTIAYSAEDANGVLQVFTRTAEGTSTHQLTHLNANCRFPFWGRASRVYFISEHSGQSALWSVNTVGGAPEVVLDDVTRAAISPGGSQLAFLRNGTLWLRADSAYKKPPFDRMQLDADTSFAFAPSGSKLLLAASGRSWWMIPADGGSAKQILHGTGSEGFAWLPDSRHILNANAGRLWIADTSSDTIRPVTNGPGRAVTPSVSHTGLAAAFVSVDAYYAIEPGGVRGAWPAWSPTVREYAYVAGQAIHLRNADSGFDRIVVSGGDYRDPAFSPGGQSIAYVQARDDGESSIQVAPITGGPAITVTRDNRLMRGPTWSPEGNWIAYIADGALEKVRADGSSKPVKITDGAGLTAAWSPVGDVIACLRPDRGVNMVSLDGTIRQETGEQWQALTWSKNGQLEGIKGSAKPVLPGLEPVRGVSSSPDGETLTASRLHLSSSIWKLEGLTVPRWGGLVR